MAHRQFCVCISHIKMSYLGLTRQMQMQLRSWRWYSLGMYARETKSFQVTKRPMTLWLGENCYSLQLVRININYCFTTPTFYKLFFYSFTTINIWLCWYGCGPVRLLKDHSERGFKSQSGQDFFSFCKFRLFRAPRISTWPIQMKSSMTIIRANST